MIPVEDITNKRHRKVIELYLGGCQIVDIARKSNYNMSSINYIAKKYGYSREYRAAGESADKMMRMYGDGMSYAEIAEKLNLKKSYVERKIGDIRREEKRNAEIAELDPRKECKRAGDRRKIKVEYVGGHRMLDITDYMAGI